MRRIKLSRTITNRDSTSLTRYLMEINNVDLLTPEEENELILRFRSGDNTAFELLTKANLRFVVSVAKKYQNNGLGLADLISEGNIGLLKAAERYDHTRGFKFITYAIWWIRQSIMKAISEHARIIRLPSNRLQSLQKIKTMFDKLEQEFEREPNAEEIAELMDVDIHDVDYLLNIELKKISVDAPLTPDGDGSWLDIIVNENSPPADHDSQYHEKLTHELRESLKHLTDKQGQVIRLHFGLDGCEPMNLREISKRLNISNERVRQLKEAAINRLRKTSRSVILREYIGKA